MHERSRSATAQQFADSGASTVEDQPLGAEVPAATISAASAASLSVPLARSCVTTPARSAAERFWLNLNLPSIARTRISMPTIPASRRRS